MKLSSQLADRAEPTEIGLKPRSKWKAEDVAEGVSSSLPPSPAAIRVSAVANEDDNEDEVRVDEPRERRASATLEPRC